MNVKQACNKLTMYLVFVFLVMVVSTNLAMAEEEAASDLAKAVQNPLANMTTLPFQANFNTGVGPDDDTFFNMNIQPVVPFPGEKWNIISRTIIPVNSVPDTTPGLDDSTFGLGDTSVSLFWSPAKAGAFTWGAGPVFMLPTASNPDVLGSEKWSIGPTGVLFYGVGKWTMGGVASNIWSFAGANDRADVNMFTMQYFVNYNLGKGWAVGTSPVVSANWEAASDETWTIPWGLQVSKVTKFGNQPVNLLVGYYHNSEHPTGTADAQLRVQLNFIFATSR